MRHPMKGCPSADCEYYVVSGFSRTRETTATAIMVRLKPDATCN